MPGDLHETVVTLLRHRPIMVADLAKMVSHDHWPKCVEACGYPESVGSPGPTERRADFVARLIHDDSSSRVVICEMQNEWSDDKYFRLPGYMSRAFDDHRCAVDLLIICGKDSVAARFRHGIRLNDSTVILPVVIGPSDLPSIAELTDASAELVVLSTILGRHGGMSSQSIVNTVDDRLATIEPGRASDYARLVMSLLADDLSALLEATMQTMEKSYHSAYSDRLRAEGRDEGRCEGRCEGRVEALQETLRLYVDTQLAGTATAQQWRRIDECSDIDQLNTWLMRAFEVSTVHELFPQD